MQHQSNRVCYNLVLIYSTDRSKAVVPVLVLFFVALWFILRGVFEPRSGHMWESQVLFTDGRVVFPRVLRFSPTFDERPARYKWNILKTQIKKFTRRFVLSLALCYFILVFFSPLSIAITSFEEERANLSAFRTFVRFALVWFCLFSLPLGVLEGLRLVIVALPGLFSYLFFGLYFLGEYSRDVQTSPDTFVISVS